MTRGGGGASDRVLKTTVATRSEAVGRDSLGTVKVDDEIGARSGGERRREEEESVTRGSGGSRGEGERTEDGQ